MGIVFISPFLRGGVLVEVAARTLVRFPSPPGSWVAEGAVGDGTRVWPVWAEREP